MQIEAWVEAEGVVVLFALLAGAAKLLHLVNDAGGAFIALCLAGVVAALAVGIARTFPC